MPRAIPGDKILFLLREQHRGTPYADASRLFQAGFPRLTAQSRQTYRRIEKKVEQHFVLTDRRSSNPELAGRSRILSQYSARICHEGPKSLNPAPCSCLGYRSWNIDEYSEERLEAVALQVYSSPRPQAPRSSCPCEV